MSNERVFTFQTRLDLEPFEETIINSYATLFGKVERKLFAKVASGLNPNQLKNSFLKQYSITARQFNALRIQIQGKIDSYKEVLSLRIASLASSINSLNIKIQKLTRKQKKFELHQKKRRLFRLEKKLEGLKKDKAEGKLRLCFGSKKLFRSQFSLDENDTLLDWKQNWQEARSSSLFILGSKDETAGNQSCVALLNEDKTLNLRLRLPKALEKLYGKYLLLKNVHFNRGHEDILNALKLKQAITYRLHKDQKGWRVFVSIAKQSPPQISNDILGAIGLDINVNHLAAVETDRFGNVVAKKTIDLNTYGKTKKQSLALIGDASKLLVEWACQVKKPIILEKLDFKEKKATLKETSTPKLSRMLSGFCYQKIHETISSKAFKHGIAVHTVNPAFTSLIGTVKFASRYGLSRHHAAAFCIARRKYHFSENPTSSQAKIPGKDAQVTFCLPARNRQKHVWAFWRVVKKKMSTALVAHFRARSSRSKDPP